MWSSVHQTILGGRIFTGVGIMKITPFKIEDKIELFAEIFGNKKGDLDLTACRFTFKEITSIFKQDEIGDGFCTLSLDQAKQLYTDLGVEIKKVGNENV